MELSSGTLWLTRIQPGDRQPRGAKDGGVKEDEEHGRATDMVSEGASGVNGHVRESSCNKQTNSLAYRAPVECPAASDSVQCEDANQSCELYPR